MTKKDLFRLLIKILGIYLIYPTLRLAIRSTTLLYFEVHNNAPILLPIMQILALMLVVLLLYVLIFQPDSIIRFLKLDKGFDNDKLEIGNITRGTLLQAGILVLGVFLIANHLPPFLSEVIIRAKKFISPCGADGLYVMNNRDLINFATHVIYIFVGWLLIGANSSVAAWLSKQGRKH